MQIKMAYADEIAECRNHSQADRKECRHSDAGSKKQSADGAEVRGSRKAGKRGRKSQKIVNQYYKNMMNTAFVDPQFTDKKK